MGNVSVPRRSLAPAALIGIAFFLLFAATLPSHAAAQTVQPSNVQTSELLPPGQNTCPAVAVTSIQPYVYGGVLESFDVTISDTSNGYVGILSTVNGTPISLGAITRWAGEPSGLRIHVDTPDVLVGNGASVSVTLLSSLPGQPTCLTAISFNVSGYGVIVPPSYTGSSAPQGTPAPAQNSGAPVSVKGGEQQTSSGQASSATSTAQSASSTAIIGSTVASAANSQFFSSVCTGNNAYRLWFILLVIYMIIVAIVVFAEPWYLESSVIGSTAAILVPLLLLLGFWYLSSACRAASWIPVVACVIAIVGLFLAFREYEVPPLLPAPSEQ